MYKFPETIFATIRAEVDDFTNNQIEIVPGYYFSQYQTIKKIHKYYSSHYDSSDYETVNGVTRKKVFHNISKWRAEVGAKQLDIDVKDFVCIPTNPETEFNVFLLEKELKAWMKKSKWGTLLNEVARYLPKYGSAVLRKTKDGAELIDLRYLMNDQSAHSLKEGRYTILKKYLSPSEMRKMGKVWDNVDVAIEQFCTHSQKSYEDSNGLNENKATPDIEIYERYGEVPLSWFTDKDKDDNEFVLAHYICAGVNSFELNTNKEVTREDGVILFKEQIKELDMKEVHYSRVEGRWLGVGVVEEVFEDQRRVNQVKDQEAKALELSSLLIFQTRDQLLKRNLLSDVENGEILRVFTEITRLDNSNRSLGDFQTVAQSYEQHANQVTFSSDVLGGEAPPASATATAVVNSVQQAGSVYDFKKEDFGLFLEEFIKDLVFPDLEKRLNDPHVFRFMGDLQDMGKMREKLVDAYLRKHIFDDNNWELAGDPELYRQTREKLLQDAKGLEKIWINVNKDFFKDVDYEISLETTGESLNVQARLSNLQFIFGLIAKNPDVLKNPILKRLIFKVMALMGLSMSELENAEVEMTENQKQQEQQQQQVQQQQIMAQRQEANYQPTTPQLNSLINGQS